MLGVRDAGDLLGRAGFSLPTVDTDEIVIMYEDAFSLMHHLRGMGSSGCMLGGRDHIPLDTMVAMAAIYEEMFGTEHGIPATFEVITTANPHC